MIAYASATGNRKNLDALRGAAWRLFLAPHDRHRSSGLRYAIDNGAWHNWKKNLPFDDAGFRSLVETHAGAADFVVIPDKVAAGNESLEFSRLWVGSMPRGRMLLLVVQDGMTAADVGAFVRNYRCGIFLGGSTEWKLKTMYGWGMLAHGLGCYYHIGRVNSAKRIRLAAEAAAHSFDGTSASMYSVKLPILDTARKQPSLLTPGIALQESA
jgi:hypothetical protein